MRYSTDPSKPSREKPDAPKPVSKEALRARKNAIRAGTHIAPPRDHEKAAEAAKLRATAEAEAQANAKARAEAQVEGQASAEEDSKAQAQLDALKAEADEIARALAADPENAELKARAEQLLASTELLAKDIADTKQAQLFE